MNFKSRRNRTAERYKRLLNGLHCMIVSNDEDDLLYASRTVNTRFQSHIHLQTLI